MADGEHQRVFADGKLSADRTSADGMFALAVYAVPTIEMSNIEMNIARFRTLATGPFGQRGWRTMTERSQGGPVSFSDIPVSDVAEHGSTGRKHNSIVVGHVKSEISAAADTDPGG